jgi:hypothetical protein
MILGPAPRPAANSVGLGTKRYLPLYAGESIILPQTLGIGTSARVGITMVQGQFIYEDLHVFHACKLGQASK